MSPRTIERAASRHREHAEAWGRVLWQKAPAVAAAIRRKPRTVQGWQEPFDPCRSPSELLVEAIEAAVALGVDQADAVAPLVLAAEDLGFDLLPRPAAAEGDVDAPRLHREVGQAVGAFGTLLNRVGRFAADGELVAGELRRIRAALMQLRGEIADVEATFERIEAQGGRLGPVAIGDHRGSRR